MHGKFDLQIWTQDSELPPAPTTPPHPLPVPPVHLDRTIITYSSSNCHSADRNSQHGHRLPLSPSVRCSFLYSSRYNLSFNLFSRKYICSENVRFMMEAFVKTILCSVWGTALVGYYADLSSLCFVSRYCNNKPQYWWPRLSLRCLSRPRLPRQ